MVGIYKITNKINGDSYIGRSVNIERRFMEHKTPKNGGGRIIHAAIEKYGLENFSFEVLEECSEEELDSLEVYYIEKLKPEYNISSGGKGPSGMRHTDEVKELLREKARAEWCRKTEEEKEKIIRENLTGPRVGHSVSEETREKLRQKNIGKKQSRETVEKRMKTMQKKRESGWKKDPTGNWKPVICLESGMVFPSVKAAAYYIGANPRSVSAVLNKRQSSCRGFHFDYAKV